MALFLKQKPRVVAGQALASQWILVSRAAAILPTSGSTDILFRVFGGRVLVHLFIGEATVVLTATDPVAKISGKRLDGTPAAVGTAVDIASTANIASLEVGGTVNVLGSGAALIKNNAGALLSTLGRVEWVMGQGEIYVTTGATNTTGQMKWDLWYQPLDPGAYVASSAVATAI